MHACVHECTSPYTYTRIAFACISMCYMYFSFSTFSIWKIYILITLDETSTCKSTAFVS